MRAKISYEWDKSARDPEIVLIMECPVCGGITRRHMRELTPGSTIECSTPTCEVVQPVESGFDERQKLVDRIPATLRKISKR